MRDRYFVPPTVSPGDSIPWSRLSDTQEIREYVPLARERIDGNAWVTYEGIPFTPIPYCTFGDYDNSTTMERSNARVMRERFPWLVHVYGSHGSEMIGFLGKRENQNPDLIEAIESLESYPVLDESDESELRMERESEAWNDHGCRDFAEFLTSEHAGIPNYGIPAGIPLVVLGLADEGTDFDHGITYSNAPDEKPARDALASAWFVVLGEYGSGETSLEEGGGGIYFDLGDWYRSMWRAMEKREARLDEIERAREIDPRIVDLESQGSEGRIALLDRYEELGLALAIEHVRYYREDRLGEVIESLRSLASAWSTVDVDDAKVNYAPDNYRRVCPACGHTGQAHPTDECRVIVTD
jgi:tetratricopeptide (TPR) repeat protein